MLRLQRWGRPLPQTALSKRRGQHAILKQITLKRNLKENERSRKGKLEKASWDMGSEASLSLIQEEL